MTMHFSDIARQAAADRAISAEDILALRRAGWADGVMKPDEAEAAFALNDALAEPTPEWSDFFVEAIGEFVINGTEPRGYVSEDNAAWLIARIDRDGTLQGMTELELLVRVAPPFGDMRHLQPALDQRQVVGSHGAKLIHQSDLHRSYWPDRSGLQRLDGDAAVGVDANVGRDIERLAHDRFGVERSVGQRAG